MMVEEVDVLHLQGGDGEWTEQGNVVQCGRARVLKTAPSLPVRGDLPREYGDRGAVGPGGGGDRIGDAGAADDEARAKPVARA